MYALCNLIILSFNIVIIFTGQKSVETINRFPNVEMAMRGMQSFTYLEHEWRLSSVKFKYKPNYKPCDLL